MSRYKISGVSTQLMALNLLREKKPKLGCNYTIKD
jgi:hypothetical protein